MATVITRSPVSVAPAKSDVDRWSRFLDTLTSEKFDFDLNKVKLPKKRDGFDGLLFMIPGISINRLVEWSHAWELLEIRNLTGIDLDQFTIKVEEPLGVRHRGRPDADDEWREKTHLELSGLGVVGMSLHHYLFAAIERAYTMDKFDWDRQTTTLTADVTPDGRGLMVSLDPAADYVSIMPVPRDFTKSFFSAREIQTL